MKDVVGEDVAADPPRQVAGGDEHFPISAAILGAAGDSLFLQSAGHRLGALVGGEDSLVIADELLSHRSQPAHAPLLRVACRRSMGKLWTASMYRIVPVHERMTTLCDRAMLPSKRTPSRSSPSVIPA